MNKKILEVVYFSLPLPENKCEYVFHLTGFTNLLLLSSEGLTSPLTMTVLLAKLF